MLGTGHDLIYLDPPFNSNATHNIGLPGESSRNRMRGRTAACSEKSVIHSQAIGSAECLKSLHRRR